MTGCGVRRSLVLPVLLVVVTACSDGGDDGPTEPDPRAAYVEQAEQVCADANEQEAEIGTPASVTEVPAAADRALAVVRETVTEVTALEPPEADRADLQAKVLDPLRADLTAAEQYVAQLKAAASANDGAALLRLVQDRPQTTADLAYMREYGFVECVKAADQKD